LTDLVKVVVDSKTFDVETGCNLFSILRDQGILNGLCYHSSIKSEQNCGLCLVEVEDELSGKKEIISSCQRVVSSPLKVSVSKAQIKGLRQSVLTLWLHHFSSLEIYTAKRFLKRLANIFMMTPPLKLRLRSIKEKTIKIEKWSELLTFNPALCIGCGLCVDFVWQNQKLKVLELEAREGSFFVRKDGVLNMDYEKSLSLVCPTEAIVHEQPHIFTSEVFPFQGQWNTTYANHYFRVSCEKKIVKIEPLEEYPFVPSLIWGLIQRYQPDLLFNRYLHMNSNLSSQKCTWYLGRSLPQSTLHAIDKAIHRRRESVKCIFDDQENVPLVSHPLASSLNTTSIIVLGPDDEITPEDLVRFKNVGMIVLSRFDQWRGKPMSDYPNIIWAPHLDVLEHEGDERFSRHFSHLLKRLAL
jgi:hypothetical protein